MVKSTQDQDPRTGVPKGQAPVLSRLEWDEMLVAKRADLSLEDLAARGTLKTAFPALYRLVGFGGQGTGHKDLWDHTKKVVIQTLPRPLVRWAALFHDCGKPVAFSRASGEITFHHHEAISARLFEQAARRSGMFEPEEITRVASIIRLLGHVEQYEPKWTDSAVRRLGVELGDLMDDVLAVARADCTSGVPAKRRRVQHRCHELKVRLAKVKELDSTPSALPHGLGDAVMARLGFQPATMTHAQRLEMGRLMRALKAMVEAGDLPRSGETALYLSKLESLLSENACLVP